MKFPFKSLITNVLAVSALLCGAMRGNAQTQLLMDPNQSWIGYMNVFALPSAGGAYQFGSAWGTGALRANYTPSTAPYSTLVITPCTNVWETTDGYWVQTNNADLPNKQMDANFYVQNDTLEGQKLTFSGYCISNTFGSPYTSTVFIKEFDGN